MNSTLFAFLLVIECLLGSMAINLSLIYWNDFRAIGSELAKKNFLYHSKWFGLILISLVIMIYSSYLISSSIDIGFTFLFSMCFLILLSLRLRVTCLSRKKTKNPELTISNSMTLVGKLVGSICFFLLAHLLTSNLDKIANIFSDLIPVFIITFMNLCNGFFGDLKVGERGIYGNLFFLSYQEIDFVIYGRNRGFFDGQYLDIQHRDLWPIYRNFRVHVEISEGTEDQVLEVLSQHVPVACKLNS
jgi:hypothetical protein